MRGLSSFSTQTHPRKGERGAALVSTLLISTLLLAAGGALILTTAMTSTTTIDSTAEMQAYYGAEAGLNAALNVLRGNAAPRTGSGLSVSVKMSANFRTAVDPVTSNYTGDPLTTAVAASRRARLSAWLDYSYPSATLTSSVSVTDASRVPITAGYNPQSGIAYSIVVTDPDNTPSPTEPNRLLISSIGYGPRGAVKQLQMMVHRAALDLQAPATITVRGADDAPSAASNLHFDVGNSISKTYSGNDRFGADAPRPAFATTGSDLSQVVNGIHKPSTVSPQTTGTPTVGVLDVESTVPAGTAGISPITVTAPAIMQTANNARAAIASLRSLAQSMGGTHYVSGASSGGVGAVGAPEFKFVDGNFTLEPGHYAGFLVVTGELTFHGNVDFDGIILVFGAGYVDRSGGGNGDINGAVLVAKFGSTGGFQDSYFDTSGGGNSNMQYDSDAVRRALNATGRRVLGIVER